VTDDTNALGRPDDIKRDPLDAATIDGVDDPATAAVRMRAEAALLGACEGWRERGRCTAADGSRIAHPHPRCLAAQYRHELILLENGISR
jgi:hypothetical protein